MRSPRVDTGCVFHHAPLGDTRCPGVGKPGLRSPLPHHGRATPRLVGSPAGVCAVEAGVFGTQHIDRTRVGRHEGLSRPSFRWSRIMRCGRIAVREESSLLSKSDGSRRQEKRSRKRPRVVISRVRSREINGCRAHAPAPSPRGASRRAKVSSAEETRAFHEARCASRSWFRSCRTSKLREARPAATTGHQRWSRSSPSREETPGQRAPRSHRSTHGDVNRRPTWFVRLQPADVLQEPHDTQAARSTARWAFVGRTHLLATSRGGSTTKTPRARVARAARSRQGCEARSPSGTVRHRRERREGVRGRSRV